MLAHTLCGLHSISRLYQSPTAICFYTRGAASKCRHLMWRSSIRLLYFTTIALHFTIGSLRAVAAASDGSSHVIWRHRCYRGWWLNFWARRRRRWSNKRRARSTACRTITTTGAITNGSRNDVTVSNLLGIKGHTCRSTNGKNAC